MKKLCAFGIIALIFCTSAAMIFNLASANSLPKEGSSFENLEKALSENIPFSKELSALMDAIRYTSGVRYFDGIYIGSEGSLLQDIEKPSSRTFSATKNYILSFGEKTQTKPYFMLVPTAAAVLKQELDTFAENDFYNQRNMITRMYSQFDGNVRTADIYQTLFDRRGEYIYYHTENLPTALGGYYIYGELCSRLGVKQNTMDSFSAAYAAQGFYGSLADEFFGKYASSDFVTLYEYIGEDLDLTVEYFDSKGSSKISKEIFSYSEEDFEDKTDMIFSGLSSKMEITQGKNSFENRSILIFGDESAKSWLPFLVTNYKKTTFIDLNSCSSEQLTAVKAGDYDQILFAYSTATFAKGIAFEKLEYIN